MNVALAIILGAVEGFTEFLPISSTGHLILVAHLFSYTGPKADVFIIFIQIGTIFAVITEYWEKVISVLRTFSREAQTRRFTGAILIAFLPAAILGVLVHKAIEQKLFGPIPVAAALIAGAIFIFILEATARTPRTTSAQHVSIRQALSIGLAQCLSLWPGFSRSAATIMGGMAVGLDRTSATEFSFFLAIPTLGAATLYSLLKDVHLLSRGDLGYLLIATIVSFIVARWAIRWLLQYISTHTLKPFAWYRVALGILVLLILYR